MQLVFAVPVPYEEAICSFESDSLLLLDNVPIDCELCTNLFEKDELILVKPIPIDSFEADQTFECDRLTLEDRFICEAQTAETLIEIDQLALEDRIIIQSSEAVQLFERDTLTLEVRCIIASKELTFDEEVDQLWVRKAIDSIDHPETTIEFGSLSIETLHRVESLEITRTFEEQYQKLHDRLAIEGDVIDQILLETYFITKEDLEDLIEIENMMKERRAGITVKRDLSNMSQVLPKLNLTGNLE